MKLLDRLLTAKRVKAYCGLLIGINSLMIGLSFVRNQPLTLSGAPFGGDFIEFHTAGRIFNEYGSNRLYDFQLQDDLIHEFLPGFSVPYVTPPYVAILFSPLARLPLRLAYLAWILLSLALYISAIALVLRLECLPRDMTLLVCLAFPPLFMLVLAGGQISAIGCFVFACWIYLMKRERKFTAGAVLGLLLYKPTLAIFIIPALMFGRQIRTLIGFAAVSALLITLSIEMIGISGLIRYLTILREFSSVIGSGYAPPAMLVDVAAFIRNLFHVNIKYISFLLALPLTYLTRKYPERAMVPTMVFNSYAPAYDLIVLVPLLVVTYRDVGPRLLTVLFVVSFLTVPICQLTGVQLITPVLLILCYSLCVKSILQLRQLRFRAMPFTRRTS
jgi:hypothetical protein